MRLTIPFAALFFAASFMPSVTCAQAPAAAPAAPPAAPTPLVAPLADGTRPTADDMSALTGAPLDYAKFFDGVVRPDADKGTTSAFLPPIFASGHASNLLQLKNGDILCVWFSGTWEGSSKVGIVFSRLPKGGKQWTKAQLIDQEEGFSYQNPVIFQAPDGVLHLYHTTQAAHEGEANAHVLEVTSNDNGATWSKPHVLFDQPGAFSRHPLLVLPDHSWLFPMTYVTSKGISKGAETNYSVTEISKDNGKTWTECKIDQSEALVQPTVLQLGPKRLIAFFRDRRAKSIYESVSTDGCKWSAPVPTVLPNNNASVQAYRLSDGHIVLIFDNTHKNPRRPVSVALSEDEGHTWKYIRDVETGRTDSADISEKAHGAAHEEYSYPTIMQTSDGMIHAAFTFNRWTIKTMTFTEDWLRQGGTAGLAKGTAQPQK